MSITTEHIKNAIDRLSNIIIQNEVHFCQLDSAAGDGDFGMSLAKGFQEIHSQMNEIDNNSIQSFLRECSMIISEFCGGASGPLWGSAFAAAANSVKGKENLELSDIVSMFEEAVAAIQKRGGAKLGDKTLLDALIPATAGLKEFEMAGKSIREAFEEAAKKAEEGANATRNMIASKGRASYVGDRSLHYPDAGAEAISIILKTMLM